MNKILIVEDELALAGVLTDYLRHHQFEVSLETDGGKAVAAFNSFAPDLVLLDIMLPNKDGLEICRELRGDSDVPIIMITARTEEIDRLLGLELGADDYICKPYSPREVIARVKAVLRRTQADPAVLKNPQLFSMDEHTMMVALRGQPLELTYVEFKLLQTLASEPRRVFSREQLMNRIYDDRRIVSDRTIDSHVNKLRKRLQTVSQADEELVRSVYGVGYKFEPPMT